MESTDDSEDSSEDGPQYSAIKQPPLIKQLKKILDEYPNDGQILKEIIQNAEDAEASWMQILFDERRVNDEDVTEKKFRKYFKGPALCVYNNAQFTKEDWEGIQMINSSVKEFDPVKIGRFGLGFKSVFHITDFPMIVSGNRMLVLDPHQKSGDRVCINMKLNKMHNYTKQMDLSYCLNALEGLFEFSKETLSSGDFNGTLFRFPLRNKKTALSDNVYDREKILELFNAFKAEASVELLFLKCLERIDLYIKDAKQINSENMLFYAVEVSSNCLDEVREKRSKFHCHMKSVGLKPAAETFTTSFNMVIGTRDESGSSIENNWFVLHCLKGGNMSKELFTLSQDESLSYSPFVSIAVPMNNDPEFKGHVFCLMPLPLEDESLTGFPVHVNGYFALSQNRRHVKWPSADAVRNKINSDKSIRWNKCLVEEVLADVYFTVIKQLIQQYKGKGLCGVSAIYRAIPDHRKVTSHWDLILNPLFKLLLNFPILYSENNGGKWIRPEQAVFEIFEGNVSSEVKHTILELMQHLKIDIVRVPDHVTSVMKARGINVQTLTLEFITTCLRSNSSYRNLPAEKKLHVLTYLMSDGNYSKLQGLELLPINNGTFAIFGNRICDKKVIICREEVDVFPGQDDIFVRRSIQDDDYDSLFRMANSGMYQLFGFSGIAIHDIATLLQKVITKYIGTTSQKALQWQSSSQKVTGMKWLETVWQFLHKYNLNNFSHLHLIPSTSTNQLYKLSTHFLIRSNSGFNEIPPAVCKCLGYLDIVVLDSLPSYIQSHKNIYQFASLPTVENVFKVLEKVQASGFVTQLIQNFNSSINPDERLQFINYISGYTKLNTNCVSLLSMMNLFAEKNSRRYVSVKQVRCIAEAGELPVMYFRESLDCSDVQVRNLALLLHVEVIEKEKVILQILDCMRSGTQYNLTEMINMMDYVFNNLSYFRSQNSMKEIAKDIKFVFNECGDVRKASELFDPDDESLRLIILDTSQFPNKQKLSCDVKMLRNIGLKTTTNLTAINILNCAKYIQNNSFSVSELKRSEKLIEVLQKNPGLLYANVEGCQLFQHLSFINFIKPSERPIDFPDVLPWYSEHSSLCRPIDLMHPMYRKLIGSTKPLLQNTMSSDLTSCFKWNKKPDVRDVIQQLLVITQRYEERFKPDLLSIIDDIYKFLAEQYDGSSFYNHLINQKWIFTENGFQMADKTYLYSTQSDVSLKPYLFLLAPEFQKQPLLEMFRKMNCASNQNTKLLIKVQEMVRDEYINGGKTEVRARADLQLIINILNALKKEPSDQISGVLFPVQQSDKSRVLLKSAKECTYSNDGDDLYGDEGHFIHQDISPDTAEFFGVPSVTDTLLEDAERLQEWGQNEPLTRRIKDLLKVYKDGLSVPKEIIQNADDAGATKVCFMYDERDKEQYGRKLIDKNMFECQGPSLWAYNNAKFTDDDLRNITKVSGATKEVDTSKIGKFGLGFCSVYNLTEVPSFLTGDQMVIFDPHYNYLADALKRKKQPGLKIDLQRNRKIIERKISQFEPFNNVFGFKLDLNQRVISFDGTLFRLPLRTNQQAACSEISSTPYDHEQMKGLIQIFVEAAGNLLLFTQNVENIEFYHLPKGETDPKNATLLHGVKKRMIRLIESPSCMPFVDAFSVLKRMSKNLSEVRKGIVKDLSPVAVSYLIEITIGVHSLLANFNINGCASTTYWMLAWASGTKTSKHLALQSSVKSTIPLASVACPVVHTEKETFTTGDLNKMPFGFYRTSHVFCYLPLPVETLFPVHINGSFAVTSDRRRLSCKTTDDKDSFDSEWNDALMCDAVCNAYILLLDRLRYLKIDKHEEYHKLWPVQYEQELKKGNFGRLQLSFYQKISDIEKKIEIFRRDDKFTSIVHSKFLDPSILETKFGDKAFDVCVRLLDNKNTIMMKLPRIVRNCFKNADCEAYILTRMLSKLEFYSKLVFPHLTDDVWDDNIKDLLLVDALDNASDKMCTLLQSYKCIPTSPNRLLRRPSELVDKNSNCSGMFSIEDERFVISSENLYTKSNRLKTLSKLGMVTNQLSHDLVIDRAHSISQLAVVCSQCALDRCMEFVKYLCRETENIESNPKLIAELKLIKFLPVKSKPSGWLWSWAGDKIEHKEDNSNLIKYICSNKTHKENILIQFACPSELYSQSACELVCSQCPVLDKSQLPEKTYTKILTILGVNSEVTADLALKNLFVLSQDACSIDTNSKNIQAMSPTIMTIYKFLDKLFLQQSHDKEWSKVLLDVANKYIENCIFLLNGVFVQPCQVVMSISEDCSPHFYSLNVAYDIKSLKGFLSLLQIKERCTSSQVLSSLHIYKTKYELKKMSENDTKLYVRLLKVLVDVMKLDELNADSLQDLHIPDTDRVLYPLNTLCMDEPTISSIKTMRFTHDSISYEIAMSLGINTKRQKKVEDCSTDLYSEDFGQHEELITRIKRILSGYPCDEGVLKELVQNADDARASEVHIILDCDSHEINNLFAESWKPLQGPAILVYNDSYFTDADIKGIQSIGIGSKGDDPTKTGQYGVGFNAVYHLTDVPSFLTRGPGVETGEVLCIMDPHCDYVPKATNRNPGRKYVKIHILKEDHPNVFSCYHDSKLMQEKGTIFRLPLRTKEFVQKSQLSKKEISLSDVRNLMTNFEKQMSEMLLFVNNVKSIRLSEISNGKLSERYSVKLKLSDKDAHNRQHFFETIEQGSKLLQTSRNLDCLLPSEIKYQVETLASSGAQKTWIIVRRIGFTRDIPVPENIRQAYKKGDIGLLPRGGVAVPVNNENDQEKIIGRVYCFLPLPLETGLPVHFNGHFALDHEARRNLWTEDHESYKSAWNKHLIADVIAPSYASALVEMKDELGFKIGESDNAAHLRKSLNIFHGYFPDVEKAKNDYFKYLVCKIYTWIYKNKIALFPSCKMISKTDACVQFHPLVNNTDMFSCVFNTLKKQKHVESFETVSTVSSGISQRVASLNADNEQRSRNNRLPALIQLCKELGVKLLDTPHHVMRSIKEAELNPTEMTPDFLLSFLKSFTMSGQDSCQLGKIDGKIEETAFKKVDTLTICIEYCQISQNFKEQIDGLPLCLTADGILRTFKRKASVFCTEYSDILRESAEHFLHHNLYPLFTPCCHGLKEFDMQGFSEFLPYTLAPETYRAVSSHLLWDPDSKSLPNKQWLKQVWDFINTLFKKKIDKKEPQEIATFLSSLEFWCLIPCCLSNFVESTEEKQYALYPVVKARYVLNMKTYSGSLKTALTRLCLPCVDDTFCFGIDSILDKILISQMNPCDLLNCLYEYKNDIKNKKLKISDCTEIMEYLTEHLDIILKGGEMDTLFNMIRELPLHINVNGHPISLDSVASVLVLDSIVSSGIKSEGMEEWAAESGTILVRTSYKLTKLYAKLGYTAENLKPIDVYTNHLLPKFRYLPRDKHLVHLIHIRDKLLAKSAQFNEDQSKLITVLKNVCFVPDKNGDLFTASHFQSPFIDPMKSMCEPEEFPGAPFAESSWEDFLIIAGLQTHATSEMVVKFARKIEHLGSSMSSGTIDDLDTKSKMLIEHMFYRNKVENDASLLDAISTIKFILPYKVNDWKNKIYNQKEVALICFKDSVPESKTDLCWTTCSILPSNVDPSYRYHLSGKAKKSIQSHLQIQINPRFQSVIHHIQNVSDALKEKSDINLIDKKRVESIKDMMIKMYDWMNEKRDEYKDELKKSLSKKPIVFIPACTLFLPCERTVKSLNRKFEREIRPYLMEIPEEYGSYFQVFQMLGMSINTTICNYVGLLEHLAIDVGNKELNPNQLKIVKHALQKIIHFLSVVTKEDTVALDRMNALFLLSRDKTLRNATSLVLSDNKDFEEKIGSDIGMPYVLDFDELEVVVFGTISDIFRKLPKKMQPHVLSDMVSKELNSECLTKIFDARVVQLREFFVSNQFKEALARILVHCNRRSGNLTELKHDDILKMVSSVDNLKIVHVESIQIRLVYNGKTVGQSERQCFFQSKRSDAETEHTLMCSFQEIQLKEWIIDSYDVLTDALMECMNHVFYDTQGLLLIVLKQVNNPDFISKALDQRSVHEYSIVRQQRKSVFPEAGVTVNSKWHRYLDNSFTDFEVGEYVALLLSEEWIDAGTFISAVYIYAKIVKKCENTSQITVIGKHLCYYEIDVGNGRTETRKAYDLYKFNSNTQEKSKEIVVFVDISEAKKDNRPLNDILQEVKEIIRATWTLPEDERRKIVKRLFKKWHPDKNHGNEDKATEVFKFIKQIVLKMENGENLESNNSADSANFNYNDPPRNSAFWAHFQTWERDTREDTYNKKNEAANGQSSRTSRQPNEQVPSEAEARQWLRQAKVDYTAAEGFLPRAEIGPHFNWICFMCYQCVEKVLKAMHYKKDCNNIPSSNNLQHLTTGLSTEVCEMVRTLMSVVGPREGMMYPDRLHIPEIPADLFDRPTAERAMNMAKELLEFAVDTL